MSIRIGIYDFFAYTIPGGLIILLLFIGITQPALQVVWISMSCLTFAQLFFFGLASYITGYICGPVFNKWRELFEKKHAKAEAEERFSAKYPMIFKETSIKDWAIWLAVVRRENLDLSFEIDKHKAVSKMLEGTSLALIIFIPVLIAYFFKEMINIWYFWLIPLLILSSILSIKQSIKFNTWYYSTVYENIISRTPPFSTIGQVRIDK